jgi:hypothetical protein
MRRPAWRPVRIGTEHEKADRDHNERLAEALLCAAAADDFAIAVDLVGWQLVPQDATLAGDKWPLLERKPLVPQWCKPITEQDRDVQRDLAVAAALPSSI